MRDVVRWAVVALVCGCAAVPPGEAGRDGAGFQETGRDRVVSVPVVQADGSTVAIQARICRPAGDAPARLVVINHGSPPDEAARPREPLGTCEREAARWFLDRGYVVMFPLRRGYGVTGGAWAEGYGGCRVADYRGGGLETARDIAAAVEYGTGLAFVRPLGVVVVGQSAGGWGTIAYDSVAHPKVSAFVVMAGGRGGHRDGIANDNCRPDRLAEAAGQYGRTASTAMLWVYAANDSFFAPTIAEAMHAAFTAAGGQATLVQPGPFPGDGHRLFFGQGGPAVWGPVVEAYLARQPG